METAPWKRYEVALPKRMQIGSDDLGKLALRQETDEKARWLKQTGNAIKLWGSSTVCRADCQIEDPPLLNYCNDGGGLLSG